MTPSVTSVRIEGALLYDSVIVNKENTGFKEVPQYGVQPEAVRCNAKSGLGAWLVCA
jgi:hypothetical protein